MRETERLKNLTKVTGKMGRKVEVSKSGREESRVKEGRVKAVYGNLAIERPDLDIERVRRVLGENRPK